MKILVTGGSGFIGSHLVERALSRGDQVSVLDNLSTSSRKNLVCVASEVDFYEGDIRNEKLVEELVCEADLVLHMAAALGVKNIMENTLESIDRNFGGSEIVLKAACRFKKRIVIASTSEIYGKNPKQPLNEESDRVVGPPQMIRWTYSDAKALEEAVAYTMHREQGLAVTTVRFFNTVGPRQSGQYGMVVPRFVKAALENEDITIYGNGDQARVFCHVDDAVSAVFALAAENSTIGEYYNVGGAGEVTIKQLAEKIIRLTNSKSKISYIPYASAYPAGFEDIPRRVPDISKISNQVGWKPRFDLDMILNSVISNMEKN